MDKSEVIDKLSVDATDGAMQLNDVRFTAFVVKSTEKDADRLRLFLDNCRGIYICFVRTSPDYLFITSKRAEIVREARE